MGVKEKQKKKRGKKGWKMKLIRSIMLVKEEATRHVIVLYEDDVTSPSTQSAHRVGPE